MPAGRWQADRHELAVTFGRSLNAEQRLAELQADQHRALGNLQAAVDARDGVRLFAGDRRLFLLGDPTGLPIDIILRARARRSDR